MRSSSPAPRRGWDPPGQGRVRAARGSGSPVPASARGLHRRPPPGAAPGAGSPVPVRGAGGAGGLLLPVPAPISRTLQPHLPLCRSAAWPPCSQPVLLSRPGVFTSSPGRGMSSPTPFPNPGIPRLPGTPSPPGIPFPSAGSSGVCTHPLPAAVALSLETGSDSGSITFSALSLSGNFCGNPSEIGG